MHYNKRRKNLPTIMPHSVEYKKFHKRSLRLTQQNSKTLLKRFNSRRPETKKKSHVPWIRGLVLLK